jgi:hypothetical protein
MQNTGATGSSVVVTPGLWCTGSGITAQFVPSATSTSCTSIGSGATGTAAVQVTGTITSKTRFLQAFGVKNITKNLQMVVANDLMTSIANSTICPSIILNDQYLSNSQAGEVAWSDKGSKPRLMQRQILTTGRGATQYISGETGTWPTAKAFWIADPSGYYSSFPTSETKSGSNDPIIPINQPSGTDFDLTKQTKYKVFTYDAFKTDSNGFSKKVNDPDYGLVNSSDNSGPQLLRRLKRDYEGKSCMALVAKEGSNGYVTVYKSVPIRLDYVCDGKRDKNLNALKDDAVTPETRCSYNKSDASKVDISISFWIGHERNSDDEVYVPAPKELYRASINGKGSNGSALGITSTHKRVDNDISYQ